MSKTKRGSVILGPDGRPYVAPKPKPEMSVTVGGVDVSADVKDFTITTARDVASDYLGGAMASYLSKPSIYTLFFGHSTKPEKKPRSLADAVGDDVAALTADFEGSGGPEMPAPVRDLDTYHGAFASAAANCLHENAIEMLYGREWTCDDCGRSIDRAEMTRAREKRGGGMYGYFFGG